MVTSSIKFWKAMEKFDVSRSLFLSKKLESSRFKKLFQRVVHFQYTLYSLRPTAYSHSKFNIQNSKLIFLLQFRCHFERNEMKPRNLNQQFKLENQKVEGSKVVVQRSPFSLSNLPYKVIQNSKKLHNGHFEYQILESNGKI